MATQRIKGQNVSIAVTGPNGEESVFEEAARSVQMTVQMEVLAEGYIGESSNRRDDIFNGITGQVEVHMQTAAFFRFMNRAKARAQRRTPAAERFDFVGVFAYDNGERVRAVIEDVFFGEMPVNIPSRGEYVTVTLNFEAQDMRTIGA